MFGAVSCTWGTSLAVQVFVNETHDSIFYWFIGKRLQLKKKEKKKKRSYFQHDVFKSDFGFPFCSLFLFFSVIRSFLFMLWLLIGGEIKTLLNVVHWMSPAQLCIFCIE